MSEYFSEMTRVFKPHWKRLGIYFVLLYGWLFYLGYTSQILAMKWDILGVTDDFEKLYGVYRMFIHFNWTMAYASMWYESPILFTLVVTLILVWMFTLAYEADHLNDHKKPISYFLNIVILVELYVVIDLLLK